MPEKPATQEDRSSVSPKDERATVPPCPTDRDAKSPDAVPPENEKRIERFPER
jgi:hypothetical protein